MNITMTKIIMDKFDSLPVDSSLGVLNSSLFLSWPLVFSFWCELRNASTSINEYDLSRSKTKVRLVFGWTFVSCNERLNNLSLFSSLRCSSLWYFLSGTSVSSMFKASCLTRRLSLERSVSILLMPPLELMTNTESMRRKCCLQQSYSQQSSWSRALQISVCVRKRSGGNFN